MPKITVKTVNDTITQRTEVISSLSRKIPNGFNVGVVDWFGHELKNSLNGFHYDLSDSPSSGGSARIDIIGQQVGSPSRLLLSQTMLDMFVHMANEGNLDQSDLNEAVDNFIVHEIVHRCQGMGEQNHRGLSVLCPNILHENDYEADASAVVILFVIRLLELDCTKSLPINAEQAWEIYAKLIKGVIYQMQLFNLLDEGEDGTSDILLTNEQVKERIISFTRWERLCIWHFQYHRALRFNQGLEIGDFQILFRPAISFRNQYKASNKFLNVHWPEKEFDLVEPERMRNTRHLSMFCLSSINRWGIRQHAEVSPQIDQAQALFTGLFTADITESSKFFLPVFNKHGFLVGDGGARPSGPTPGGGGGGIGASLDSKAKEDVNKEDTLVANSIESYFEPSIHRRVAAERDVFETAIDMFIPSKKSPTSPLQNTDESLKSKSIIIGHDEELKKRQLLDGNNQQEMTAGD